VLLVVAVAVAGGVPDVEPAVGGVVVVDLDPGAGAVGVVKLINYTRTAVGLLN
jgi:hypothetical protein